MKKENLICGQTCGCLNNCAAENRYPETKPLKTPEQQAAEYIQGVNGKRYPIAQPRNQHGLKRDIVELAINLATPDDDCMLSDFLHALQFVLDKHGVVSARP